MANPFKTAAWRRQLKISDPIFDLATGLRDHKPMDPAKLGLVEQMFEESSPDRPRAIKTVHTYQEQFPNPVTMVFAGADVEDSSYLEVLSQSLIDESGLLTLYLYNHRKTPQLAYWNNLPKELRKKMLMHHSKDVRLLAAKPTHLPLTPKEKKGPFASITSVFKR